MKALQKKKKKKKCPGTKLLQKKKKNIYAQVQCFKCFDVLNTIVKICIQILENGDIILPYAGLSD